MAEYRTTLLAIESIELVQNILKEPGEAAVQLNAEQCKILAQDLAVLLAYLRGVSVNTEIGQDVLQIALLHLYSVIKRAEVLVKKCCCENLESWLVEAMTLVEIHENFAATALDLHYWTMALDVAIASDHRKKELLMIMDKEYQESYKKLRSGNNVLQQAAVEDKKSIVSKLAEVHELENRAEFLRATHLKYWLGQLEEEALVAALNDLQISVEHENGSDPLLGQGACGVVRRVKWLGLQCALKVLKVKDEQEATLLKGLLHPNIIRLYLYWESPSQNPRSNLLMELMDIDLSDLIGSRLKDRATSSKQHDEMDDTMPFSLPVAIDIMLQVAQAMRYMHDRHLTHRDLKTSNILVRPMNEALTDLHAEGYLEIKLADFGVAKAYDHTTTSQRHTVNTGTAVYGAPEIFGKELATERSFPPMADVWSFGVTCAEILSGKKPYANEPRATLQRRIAKEGLRSPLPEHCPEYLAFIIRSCWEFQPQNRPDFASVCRMLRHAKLLSLGITKLDDSRSFIAYTTRRDFHNSLHDPTAPRVGIISRFASLFQTKPRHLKTNLKGLSILELSLGDQSPISGVPRFPTLENIPRAVVLVPGRYGAEMGVEDQTEESDRKLVIFDDKRYSFDLEDLLQSRAETLGRGSVGSTYKAFLEDGTIVVVKRIRFDRTVDNLAQWTVDFESQVQVLGKLHHWNIVPLCARYSSEDEKLLVCDFMHMGSLAALLHGNWGSSGRPLVWVARRKIATGAARGLAYLHAQGPKFVHANIKSSNVLLKRGLDACISDFGFVQLLTSWGAQFKITGYQAPEITDPEMATQKSDVYSFGVLLLELLTRKSPTQVLQDEGIDLPRWVQSTIRDYWTAKVFDLELLQGIDNVEGELVNLLQIAMRCMDPVPERRPTMSNVHLELKGVRPISQ